MRVIYLTGQAPMSQELGPIAIPGDRDAYDDSALRQQLATQQ